MKNTKLKRLLSLFIVIIMLMSSSVYIVSAAESEETPEFSLDGFRMITLTDEAKEMALQDFDYLSDMILEVAPTVNIAARRLGMSIEDYLGNVRQVIDDKTPIPSFTYLYLGDDWLEEQKDPLYLAADYLISLLTLVTIDFDGLGHMSPLDTFTYEQTFMAISIYIKNEKEMLELGVTQENMDFIKLHYDIYNSTATLRLYEINPDEFDSEIDMLDDIGVMDEDNVYAEIVEPDRIAYLQIKSFMNNLDLDLETIYPFFYEIQEYEHLIIDLRGNPGGFTNYFPTLLILLLDEPINFQYPEFYVESELTAKYYENPVSMMDGTLQGIYNAEKFVEEHNMTEFNRDDLELLDSVLLWETEFEPYEEFSVHFKGKIWLLVDESSASASEIAAYIAVNTGFATVVGEPTAGVSGVIHTFASLPNTGVLFRIDLGYTVDNYGRSIEEFGVIPNIINKPGLDALETTIALINAPKVGTPLGDVLNTDITAYINDYEIPASTIAGKTLVKAEDLARYGFNVAWNGKNKTLNVELNKGKKFDPLPVEKDTVNKPGSFKENYLYTDIQTFIAGEIVESYAINGVTLINIDSLGKFGTFSWNNQTRELRLTID